MEDKSFIIDTETTMMQKIRDIIPQIVGIRLDVQKIAQWLKVQGVEFDNASDEISDAIESLAEAEETMGKAHQHILVSQATLKHSQSAE